MQGSWPDSLWAAVTPAGADSAPLEGALEVDLLVIGAGLSGLSAALEGAERGVRVAVLEADHPGFGASGRSNGQVIPTLTRPDPEDLLRRWGEAGERFVALLRDSAAHLFREAIRLGVACEAEQSGWIQPVHSPGRMRIAERRVQQWRKHGANVELLDRAATVKCTGSDFWYGAWRVPDGGHINPLALTRGLAEAVRRLGAEVFPQSPVQRMVHNGERWVATTPKGQVRAQALVLATHALTDAFAPGLHPELAREVVPAYSWMLATKPLSSAQRQMVLPSRSALSDTRGDLHFARYDARHRLVSGAALLSPINAVPRLKAMVGRRLQRMFPGIATVEFDYVWSGFLGMTHDYTPRIHRIGPLGYAWAGCNGRGLGLAVSLGRELARAALGDDTKTLALPLEPIRPIRQHALARRLGPLKLLAYRWRDTRELR